MSGILQELAVDDAGHFLDRVGEQKPAIKDRHFGSASGNQSPFR
jgi:thermostable 8-oxoguanine DNA glycosylase